MRRSSLRHACGSHTFADMKDAVITVRVPRATRRRIETLARREGRSLSQQIERLLDAAMEPPRAAARSRGARTLAGTLGAGRVPTMADFREVRALLSAALDRRASRRGVGLGDDERRR